MVSSILNVQYFREADEIDLNLKELQTSITQNSKRRLGAAINEINRNSRIEGTEFPSSIHQKSIKLHQKQKSADHLPSLLEAVKTSHVIGILLIKLGF
jgi:hypothetical protein